jgi:hypothetical protein
MKQLIHKIGIAVLLTIVSAQAFAALPSYTGSLTSANGGLAGTGGWVDPSLLKPSQQSGWFGPSITWTVSQNADLTWHYDYTFSVYRTAISHAIVEVSDTFGGSNIWNAAGSFGRIEIQDYSGSNPSNPGMPGAAHGIKFDNTIGTTVHIAFDSNRVPVWGDFYVKGGKTEGTDNALWNAGFALPDPLAPISNGSLDNHILVPDTINSTPEPASFVSLAAGLMGLLGLKTRRRSR